MQQKIIEPGSTFLKYIRNLVKYALFTVKKQGKNGIWTTVSLIDENGSFRGEAKFETREEAEKYLKDYKRKIKREQEVQVFEETVEKKAKPGKKAKN